MDLLKIELADLLLIVSYLDGEGLNFLLQSSRGLLKALSVDEISWKTLCELHGFKQIGTTRTRGRRSFRRLYRDNLCVECREHRSDRGLVIFDLAGGGLMRRNKNSFNSCRGSRDADGGLIGVNGSKVALCSACLQMVTTCGTTWSARKDLLPKLKHRDLHYNTLWNALMNKIPFGPVPKKQKISAKARAEGVVEGATFNDYLIRSVLPSGKGKGKGVKRPRKTAAASAA